MAFRASSRSITSVRSSQHGSFAPNSAQAIPAVSSSSFGAIPAIVEGLLIQLASEYEVLQSENRRLRETLQPFGDIAANDRSGSPSRIRTSNVFSSIAPRGFGEVGTSSQNAARESLFSVDFTSASGDNSPRTHVNVHRACESDEDESAREAGEPPKSPRNSKMALQPLASSTSFGSRRQSALNRAKTAPFPFRKQLSVATNSTTGGDYDVASVGTLPSVMEHHKRGSAATVTSEAVPTASSMCSTVLAAHGSSLAVPGSVQPSGSEVFFTPIGPDGSFTPGRDPSINRLSGASAATIVTAIPPPRHSGTNSTTLLGGLAARGRRTLGAATLTTFGGTEVETYVQPTFKARIPDYFRTTTKELAGNDDMVAVQTLLEKMHSDIRPSQRMLSPIGIARTCWDIGFCVALIVDFLTTLFGIVFLDGSDVPGGFTALVYALTAFFCMDIVMNFHTGYIDQGRLVMYSSVIARRYAYSWFGVDVVATVPWALFLPKSTSVISLIRIAKMPKIAMNFSNLWTMHTFSGLQDVPLCVASLLVLLVLLLAAHIHACLWRLAMPHDAMEEFTDAIDLYHEGFWWAFTTFACGTSSAHRPWLRTLEIAIASERLIAFIVFGVWGTFRMAVACKDNVNLASMTDDALSYMRGHRVGPLTQLQVVCAIREVTKGRSARDHFHELLCLLPSDLRRTINHQMWKAPLLSLELLEHIASWHPAFLPQLLMLVEEESVPSLTILCHEGDAQSKVYKITAGELMVDCTQSVMPDLLEGMWVGEHALVNPHLRSSGTVTSKHASMLMSIPVLQFHELVLQLGIADKLKEVCANQLWKGLCGRCGAFGHHFADDCHTIKKKKKKMTRAGTMNLSRFKSINKALPDTEGVDEEDWSSIQADLQQYLLSTHLQPILPLLNRRNIGSLHEFEVALDDPEFRRQSHEEAPETLHVYLTERSIQNFREQAAAEMKATLEMRTPKKCLVFLSHYKVEAGTEAALMRAELNLLIDRDPRNLSKFFEVPVFLDSENLNDLDALQQHVMDSHNLVLLLTKGVLQRPWVLVEILTATRNNVPIIPMQIVKPEAEFVFPDDEFYAKLLNGETMDKSALKVLEECDINLAELEKALRGIFKHIAVRYSPHRAASIRQAELEALLREVTVRKRGSKS